MDYLYVIWLPPDPTSLVVGGNQYGDIITMTSPPTFDLRGGSVTRIPIDPVTIPSPDMQEPSGSFTDPDDEETTGELEFSEGDEEGTYTAPMPDTEGKEYEFTIDVPMEEGEAPETIPLTFRKAGYRPGGTIGQPYVYLVQDGVLSRVDAETGEEVKSWSDISYDNDAVASSGSHVVVTKPGGYYRISGDIMTKVADFLGYTYWTDHLFDASNNLVLYGYDFDSSRRGISQYSSSTWALTASNNLNLEAYDLPDIVAFGLNGDVFVEAIVNHGLFVPAEGYERIFLKIIKFNSTGRKQWAMVFDDWIYGDTSTSSESVESGFCDESGNFYSFGIASYSDGETSHGFRRIHKISSAGVLVWTIQQEITAEGDPREDWPGIVGSPSGFMIAVFDEPDEIKAVSPDGDILWTSSDFSGIVGVQISSDYYIYIQDSTGLHRLDFSGSVLWTNTDFAYSGGGPA